MRPLTRQQVREVDRGAIEEFGVHSLVLMENAGRGVAELLANLGVQGRVVICCGKGNNGGDGFVMARHLDLMDVETRTITWWTADEMTSDAAANCRILQLGGAAPIVLDAARGAGSLAAEIEGADWIVDALLGTGATGEPRSPLEEAIGALNASPARKMALDVPSGLDCDSGRPAKATFRADHTCTFVAEKIGFSVAEAAPYLGRIHVVGIGVPKRCVSG